MNWQDFVALGVVFAAMFVLIWRSSGKKTGHGPGCQGKCGCGHAHDDAPAAKKPGTTNQSA